MEGIALPAALTRALGAEERFLLSAWYLDQRTLVDIARVCGVHESTVWRQLKRLTERLKKDLVKSLQVSGLSRQASEEALFGTDPRDLEINLRSLLQSTQTEAFQEEGSPRNGEPV